MKNVTQQSLFQSKQSTQAKRVFLRGVSEDMNRSRGTAVHAQWLEKIAANDLDYLKGTQRPFLQAV